MQVGSVGGDDVNVCKWGCNTSPSKPLIVTPSSVDLHALSFEPSPVAEINSATLDRMSSLRHVPSRQAFRFRRVIVPWLVSSTSCCSAIVIFADAHSLLQLGSSTNLAAGKEKFGLHVTKRVSLFLRKLICSSFSESVR